MQFLLQDRPSAARHMVGFLCPQKEKRIFEGYFPYNNYNIYNILSFTEIASFFLETSDNIWQQIWFSFPFDNIRVHYSAPRQQ